MIDFKKNITVEQQLLNPEKLRNESNIIQYSYPDRK